MRRLAGLLLAAATLAAGAPAELLREEAFNYRVVGELPAGWERKGAGRTFTWSLDGVVHADVRLLRERVAGELDVEALLRKRAPHYRFPSAPESAPLGIRPVSWAGRPAFLLEHEAVVGGVVCRRRVRALHAKSIWYELIETVFGEKTEQEPACRDGLSVFREGFRLLAPPLSPEELRDRAARTLRNEEFGFEIHKPEGFLRGEVDTGADPGCRLSLERAGPPPAHARVRIFEYGLRETLDAEKWLGIFFTGFAGAHGEARRIEEKAPSFEGARAVWAERFEGKREGRLVATRIYLAQAAGGRVLCLRIRTTGGAAELFRKDLEALLGSFRLTPR